MRIHYRALCSLGVCIALAVGGTVWQAWGNERAVNAPLAAITGVAPLAPLPQDAGKDLTTPKHAKSPELLARTAMRLHAEALQHFYSDPRNGLSRMPLVYEKVVKEWKTPEFSPGEIEQAKEIRDDKDLKKIHAWSMQDFMTPGKSLKETSRLNGLGANVNFNNKWTPAMHWEAKSVDLVGLIMHDEPVVYVSEKIPDMKKLKEMPTRGLDSFETMGLDSLHNGKELYALERDGVVRLLGAVRANASCIKCHDDKKEGDLLGAFSYTLREAQYARRNGFGRGGNPLAPGNSQPVPPPQPQQGPK